MLLIDIGINTALIANQTRVYALAPGARGRINTVFFTAIFAGARSAPRRAPGPSRPAAGRRSARSAAPSRRRACSCPCWSPATALDPEGPESRAQAPHPSPSLSNLLAIDTIYLEPAVAAYPLGRRSWSGSGLRGGSRSPRTGTSRCCTAMRLGRGLGADQALDPGARGQEGPRLAAERPQRPLHRAVELERLRHGLRLLLRAAPQGLRQPDHPVRQHRGDRPGDRPPRRRPGPPPRPRPDRRPALGQRPRRERRPLGRRDGEGACSRPRRAFRGIPNAKASFSFATKFVNPDLLAYRPRGQDPHPLLADARAHRPGGRRADLADAERIAAIDAFVAPATRSTSTSRR